MTDGFEVVDNLIRKKKATRMGLYDGPWGQTIEKWRGEGHLMTVDPLSGEKNPVDPGTFFEFDMASVSWFNTVPYPTVNELLEESNEWTVSRDGAGAVFKRWKKRPGTPEHIAFDMNSQEVWEKKYKPQLLKLDTTRFNAEQVRKGLALRREGGRWAFYGNLFVWEILRKSLGDFCMFESLATDPGWIHDFNRTYTDFFKMHFNAMFEMCGKPDGIWLYDDLGYRNGLFCSPAMLDDLFTPYYTEIVEFFHSHDLPVVLHSCGGIEAALPLISQWGFDALNPMEVKAGCDVVRFAKKYRDQFLFIGGMDALIYESGDKALIRREVERITRSMKEIGARYVFGSDHSISTNVAYDDFVYAIEVYKENMHY
jgi:uroporphyrinogen decarboxylase